MMHSETVNDEILDQLTATLGADRAALRAAVDRVPESARHRRPAPGAWSVAEVLEHLAIVEERAAGIVAQLAADAPPRANGAPGASADFDRAVLRDRTQRVEAPPPIQPTGSIDTAAALARLERSREALLAAMRGAAGRDLAAVQRTHPRLGPLNGYQWIAALGGHEERHTAQVREIAERVAAG